MFYQKNLIKYLKEPLSAKYLIYKVFVTAFQIINNIYKNYKFIKRLLSGINLLLKTNKLFLKAGLHLYIKNYNFN